RAVAADQTDDLTRVDVDRHAVDRADATERDLDIPKLGERDALRHRRRRGLGQHRSGAHVDRRRTTVSSPTAATRTIPTTMSWVGESTSNSTIPERSD